MTHAATGTPPPTLMAQDGPAAEGAELIRSADDPHLARLARFAATLFDAPMALVTLLDAETQHVLARHGTDLSRSERRDSFCQATILSDDVLVVPDAARDERFGGSALVTAGPRIRFYAGSPIRDPDGRAVGAVCVMDTVPRDAITPLQREGLAYLAEDATLLLGRHHQVRVDERASLAQDAALSDSRERFRVLADTMPQMVWSTRPDGFHDYYNARWYEFTGMPAGSTDGEAWNGMFHPEDQDRAWAVWRHSLETGEPYQIEYRLRHRSGEYRWVLGRALPILDDDGRIARWFGTCTDIDAQKRAAEEREIISQELSHRIKNIFSVVAGLISFAARSHPEIADVARDLRERILSLGRAHDFVRPHSPHSRPETGEASLHGLLGQLLKPYRGADRDRIVITGDDCAIDDRSATPLALLFHELATNAAKYGAFSSDDGSVRISCVHGDDGEVRITWCERGGPPVTDAIGSLGFGSKLVEMAAVRQLGGRIERDWSREGLTLTAFVPETALSR